MHASADDLLRRKAVCRVAMELVLEQYVKTQEPSASEHSARKAIVGRLNDHVRHFKYPRGSPARFCLQSYGGFENGLYSSSSDLDLSLVEVGTHEYDCKPEGGDKDIHRMLLIALGAFLQQRLGTELEAPPTYIPASTPVLQLTLQGVPVDITLYNNVGMVNSRLLALLFAYCPCFKQLCQLVKAWATQQDLVGGAAGKFNSYCLTLLCMFYLQTQQVLPPVKALYYNARTGRFARREITSLPQAEHVQRVVAANVQQLPPSRAGLAAGGADAGAGFRPAPSLLVAFHGLLRLLAVLLEEYAGPDWAVRPWHGKLGRPAWSSRHRDQLTVEDPCDPTSNPGGLSIRGTTALERLTAPKAITLVRWHFAPSNDNIVVQRRLPDT